MSTVYCKEKILPGITIILFYKYIAECPYKQRSYAFIDSAFLTSLSVGLTCGVFTFTTHNGMINYNGLNRSCFNGVNKDEQICEGVYRAWLFRSDIWDYSNCQQHFSMETYDMLTPVSLLTRHQWLTTKKVSRHFLRRALCLKKSEGIVK